MGLSFFVSASCSDKPKEGEFVPNDYGFAFKHCENNTSAPKVKAGDILLGELEIRLNDSTLLSSNFGSPDRLFRVEKAETGSMEEFLLNLHIGDSAIIVAPADSVSRYVGGFVNRPTDKIYFYIRLHQIISKQELTEQEKEARQRLLAEDSTLADFVARRYPKAEKMKSGLYILSRTKTEGKQAEFGKMVKVSYAVSDTTGKVLDTNIKFRAVKGGIYNPAQMYKPFEFMLGDDGLIAGWTEGVSYMHKGEKCSILIPSRLAYGEAGYGAITPYSPLIFDLELVDCE